MRASVLSLLVCCGCAGASGAVAGAVAINTAVALSVAAARRSAGECYTPCTPGTVCNPKTGYCDALPCHGRCRADQICAQEGTFSEHCEAGRVVLDPQVPLSRAK